MTARHAFVLCAGILMLLSGLAAPASVARAQDAVAAPAVQLAQNRTRTQSIHEGEPWTSHPGGNPGRTNRGTGNQSPFVPQAPPQQHPQQRQLADPAIESVAWIPALQHTGPDSLVQVTVRSTAYAGPVDVSVQQPNSPLQDKRLGPAVAFAIQPGSSLTVKARVTSPPGRIACIGTPRLVVAIAAGNAASARPLNVAQPGCISAELEGGSPMADTALDRVTLWLRRNRDVIVAESRRNNVPREAIAGVIAWEALQNVATVATYQGPGKVHPDPNSAAEHVEIMGYVARPNPLNPSERWGRVKDTAWAVRYIAAIMGAYADLNEQARSAPDGAIRGKPEILATLYQGIMVRKTLIPPSLHIDDVHAPPGMTPIRPLNALPYFQYKARNRETYRPNAEMGAWVQQNVDYLRRAFR